MKKASIIIFALCIYACSITQALCASMEPKEFEKRLATFN